MLRNYILETFAEIFIVFTLVFVIVKVIMMRRAKLKRDYTKLFFKSLQVHNYGSIRNTFDVRLKKYFQTSNTVNKIFYPLFIIIFVIYILMSMI